MKFWIDENIPYSIVKALQQAGYETYLAPRRTDDLVILNRAREAIDFVSQIKPLKK